MSRYVIERDIPAIGTAEREALHDAAQPLQCRARRHAGGAEAHPVGTQLCGSG